MSDFALNRTDQMLVPRTIRIPKRAASSPAKAPKPPKAPRPVKASRPPRRRGRRLSRDITTHQSAERVIDLHVRSTSLWPRAYR